MKNEDETEKYLRQTLKKLKYPEKEIEEKIKRLKKKFNKDEKKEWDYWAIELDPKKMDSGYLSIWFNENIPKQQILGAGSGSTIPHLTKKNL